MHLQPYVLSVLFLCTSVQIKVIGNYIYSIEVYGEYSEHGTRWNN